MTELVQIFLTAFVTLGLYVIGQLLSKFFIEPVQELKKAMGAVRFTLDFHAPVIFTPAGRTDERSEKAYEALMTSSCDLLAKVDAVPFYGWLSKHSRGFLPPETAILDAATNLRGLSTHMYENGIKANESLTAIQARVTLIKKKLGIESREERAATAPPARR